jgi:SPP1 gp7 family putative phage head morphogenesis protein
MAWAVTTDPARFDEACDWFLKRVVIDEAEALRLGTDAGRRAFWIGRGLQLTQIQRVFDEIDKALVSGEPFEDWRKRVKDKLRDDAHAETVFRNATQRAYNAGRYRQMRDAAKWRPYWQFDGIHDSRQSSVCRAIDPPGGPETVLPADHPFWLTHVPPLHHRCRSAIRSLRKSEGEKRVRNVPPAVPAEDGFGAAPDADPDWKPDPSKHDPALIAELDKKSKKERKPPAKPKAPPKEHDPKYWEGVYSKPTEFAKEGYDAAAPALGWGRAMLERGLDRTPVDVIAELERLQKSGHTAVSPFALDSLRKLKPNRALRAQGVSASQWRGLIALQEHTRTIQTGEFLVSTRLPATRGAKKFYELTLDTSVKHNLDELEVILRRGERAYFTERDLSRGIRGPHIVLGDPDKVRTAVHELAHALEHYQAKAVGRSRAFLKARTKGETKKKLRDLFPGRGYRDDEEIWEDRFFEKYWGKDYGESATEITSMGYERMLSDWDIEELAAKDPELLHFLLGQLAGR